jgi:antirestriction protein ArdC
VPRTDNIHMPPRDVCIGTATSSAAEAYYSTKLHELTHYAEFRIMPRGLSSSLLFQREDAPLFGITLAH